jgi:putative colanic acid biosynthesis UDP-glucose lipid carrier transferase
MSGSTDTPRRNLNGMWSGQAGLSRLALIVAFAESVSLIIASMLAYYLREKDLTAPFEYILATLLATGLTMNLLYFGKTYQWLTHPTINTKQVQSLLIWVFSVLIVIALLYISKSSDVYSRTWMILYLMFGSLALLVTRSIAYAVVLRWRSEGFLREPVAVLGSGRTLRDTINQIMEDQSDSIRISGGYVMEEDLDDTGGPNKLFGSYTDLKRKISKGELRNIVLAFEDPRSALFERAAQELRLMPVNLTIAMPQVMGATPMPVLGVGALGNQTVLSVTVRPLDGIDGLFKFLEDRILGIVFLIIGLPIMGLIALAILVTDGRPVIFRQRRAGFEGDDFIVYKFRTMRVMEDGSEITQAQRADPRVTAVGRFLRRTSLDELPQLINVLKGEMSIVGPRPHALAHDSHYAPQIDGYLSRYRVKPGLTGWAQVNGFRGETDTLEKMRQRVEFDLHYIENWSLALDLRIILMTVAVLFGSKNAY